MFGRFTGKGQLPKDLADAQTAHQAAVNELTTKIKDAQGAAQGAYAAAQRVQTAAQNEITKVSTNRNAAQKETQIALQRADEAEKKSALAYSELAQARENLAIKQTELDTVKTGFAESQNLYAQELTNKNQAYANLAAAQESAAEAAAAQEAAAQAAQSDLAKVQIDLETAREQLAALQADRNGVAQNRNTKQSDLLRAQQDLEAAQKDLEAARADLENVSSNKNAAYNTIRDLEAQLEAAQSAVRNSEAQLSATASNRNTNQQQLAAAQANAADARADAAAARAELAAAKAVKAEQIVSTMPSAQTVNMAVSREKAAATKASRAEQAVKDAEARLAILRANTYTNTRSIPEIISNMSRRSQNANFRRSQILRQPIKSSAVRNITNKLRERKEKLNYAIRNLSAVQGKPEDEKLKVVDSAKKYLRNLNIEKAEQNISIAKHATQPIPPTQPLKVPAFRPTMLQGGRRSRKNRKAQKERERKSRRNRTRR